MVNKADQLITFDPIPNKTESDPIFTLNASVNSGLTIRFVSTENLIAEIINGNQVKINKPGTVRIEAIQKGDANYNPVMFAESLIYPDIFRVGTNSFTPNGDGINDQWILVDWNPIKRQWCRFITVMGGSIQQQRIHHAKDVGIIRVQNSHRGPIIIRFQYGRGSRWFRGGDFDLLMLSICLTLFLKMDSEEI